MFVLLAVVFAAGFVVFGVGAGGTGIGDIFRDSSSSDSPSVGSARDATEKNPADAQAWRELATAYQTDGKTSEAIDALVRYTTLRPRDVDGLRELAGLYLGQANTKMRETQVIRYNATLQGGSGLFTGGITTSSGVNPLATRITKQIDAATNEETTSLLGEAGTAFSQAVATYQRVVAFSPKDPNAHLELADAARQANDLNTALSAYKRFLVLAPDDPTAEIVKQYVAQIEAAVKGTSASGS
jgi:Flp pilus assembly protein TadD